MDEAPDLIDLDALEIRFRVIADGLPIGMALSPGEAHDGAAYADLMDRCESDPGILLADRGCDSDATRDVRDRGATPEIPAERNRKVQHAIDRRLRALRNGVERSIDRPKNNRRVAARHDRSAAGFVGLVPLGCTGAASDMPGRHGPARPPAFGVVRQPPGNTGR